MVINVDVRKPPAVVPEQKSSTLARSTTITEQCIRTASAVFFHPETRSELSQAGHTPNVHIVTNACCWKVKSVVCKIKKDISDICSVRDIYFLFREKDEKERQNGRLRFAQMVSKVSRDFRPGIAFTICTNLGSIKV